MRITRGRALRGKAPTLPRVVVEEPDEDAAVDDVVRAAIARSVARLVDSDQGVRLGEDPEAIHQARVATRRLRSDLRTFRPVLDGRWSTRLRDDLKPRASALGAVRDAEVLRSRLRGREALLGPNDGRALDRVVAILDARRDEAREALLRSMAGRRYRATIDRLVDAARDPRVLPGIGDDRAADALGALMRRPWKALGGSVDRARREATDASLHEVRIHAKRARYAAEALAPAFGTRARTFAAAAEALQDLLGEHQDAVVADAFLREAGAGSIAEAFVAGELAAIEAEARRAARARWPAVWEELDRKRLRFWT